jgi:DNA modification methylase
MTEEVRQKKIKVEIHNDHYTIYNGSMLDMKEVIKPNSIDSIVCDPPYHLTSITERFGKENSAPAKYGEDGSFSRLSKGFMNQTWDGGDIAFRPETWRKCYEVLKPGGYLLAFGGSRTFHRMAVAIEDAGFEIRDTIMWLYGSGFPKSLDISKAIDKKGGNPLIVDEISKAIKKARLDRKLTFKYCDNKYCNGSTNWSWYEGRKGLARVPDVETFNKICEEFNELSIYKEDIQELEREEIGTITRTKGIGIPAAGKTLDRSQYEHKITTPNSDNAKQWQGWGTALKPAYEPIIVARKPFKTSLVENVMKHGVGGINIDECMVPLENDETIATNVGFLDNLQSDGWGTKKCITEKISQGRFPANVIHDDSFQIDEETQANRYFYTAKASKKDRDEGLEIDSSIITDGRKKSIDNAFNRGETLRKNIHPTVKPVELMQYLVRLVSPKGATILDPFMGSGSTGKAVMFENRERNANYKFIGIDLEEKYCQIAIARIDYALNKFEYDYIKEKQEAEARGQANIFDFIEVN